MPHLNVSSVEKSVGTYNHQDYLNVTILLSYVTRMYSGKVLAVNAKLKSTKPGILQRKEIGNCTLQVYGLYFNCLGFYGFSYLGWGRGRFVFY